MQIRLEDGSTIDVEEGCNAQQLAQQLKLTAPEQAVALSIDGEMKDPATPLEEGNQLIFYPFDHPKGRELFWHTGAHLLAQAVMRLYPEALPTIGPPLAEGGFYYDFANLSINDEELPRIEKTMKEIAAEGHVSQRVLFASKAEACSHFAHNPYKLEILADLPEEGPFTGYRQGEFFDLCRGPHLFSLHKIKAIKLLKVAGAYWRGDSKREMLTRIYGIVFPSRELLQQYLSFLEEAKKRDHKVVGPRLGLFSLKEEAPGMPFFHPRGMAIWHALQQFNKELLDKYDYCEIKTPVMMTRELWELSGHWSHYREHMFTSQVEEREFAIKPMNCPGCMLFYKSGLHSYRELPMRVAEVGHVHRFEPSGALSGLLRVRCFHQDDAHIFMLPEQISSEIASALAFADEVYSTFGLDYTLELSTRPTEGTIGSDEEWEQATAGLKEALERSGRPFRINEGDGAFYGPKIDFHIRDALHRSWQCATIQLDMALPERFGLEYTAPDGSRKRPVMIHRALFGSFERFFAILIEHFAGRFPLWFSPEQLRLLTVADRHREAAALFASQLRSHGFRATLDESGESVSKKVRNAQLDQVNYILTIGDREEATQTAYVRRRDGTQCGAYRLEQLLPFLQSEVALRSLEPHLQPLGESAAR